MNNGLTKIKLKDVTRPFLVCAQLFQDFLDSEVDLVSGNSLGISATATPKLAYVARFSCTSGLVSSCGSKLFNTSLTCIALMLWPSDKAEMPFVEPGLQCL